MHIAISQHRQGKKRLAHGRSFGTIRITMKTTPNHNEVKTRFLIRVFRGENAARILVRPTAQFTVNTFGTVIVEISTVLAP